MIESHRLILRRMREDDFHDLLRIFTDENVMKSFNLLSFSQPQMQKWMNRNLDHQKKYGYGQYSVILKSNQNLIGDCGLEHTELEGKPCVEIGYDFSSIGDNKVRALSYDLNGIDLRDYDNLSLSVRTKEREKIQCLLTLWLA